MLRHSVCRKMREHLSGKYSGRNKSSKFRMIKYRTAADSTLLNKTTAGVTGILIELLRNISRSFRRKYREPRHLIPGESAPCQANKAETICDDREKQSVQIVQAAFCHLLESAFLRFRNE